MSSAVGSTSAALGRPFLFDADVEGEACHPEHRKDIAKRSLFGVEGSLPYLGTSLDPRLARITSASRLEIRPGPEMATSGIPALDALSGGLPRGCLTEIYGPASSGRTSVMLAALAAATRRGEYCALIDASDTLDPHSLTAAGIDLDRLLWVRCAADSPQRHRDTEKKIFKNKTLHNNQSENRLEQVLRATDLLLESGGFGMILLDLAEIPHQSARRIPLTTWFRFRRAVEHKPTILLAIEQQPVAGSCSSLQLQLQVPSSQFPVLSSNQFSEDPATWDWKPSHAHLLTELKINAELIRSRLDRKPARSVAFETKTAWAG